MKSETTKPIFLLQNNYFDQIGRLIQPCLDFCNKHDVRFIDRSLTETFDPGKLSVDWNAIPGVVIYGSMGWVKRCATSVVSAWVFYDSEGFAASNWVPVLGGNALNGDGEVQAISEIGRRLRCGERVHIRPNRDDKAFNGSVYDIAAWESMLAVRHQKHQSLPDSKLECWISPVKEIEAEYRCWFIDHTLVDVSMYRDNGEFYTRRETASQVLQAAVRLAAEYLPIGNVVMDIAKTPDGYKVIEFNPINSSGWYAASTETILSRWCEALVQKRKDVTATDK
jgi:hypothetical protein